MALADYAPFRPIHNIFLKGNKISGFEINHERASLCILGDFGIMKWTAGTPLPKSSPGIAVIYTASQIRSK